MLAIPKIIPKINPQRREGLCILEKSFAIPHLFSILMSAASFAFLCIISTFTEISTFYAKWVCFERRASLFAQRERHPPIRSRTLSGAERSGLFPVVDSVTAIVGPRPGDVRVLC